MAAEAARGIAERAASSYFGIGAGQSMLIELPDGKQRTLKVDGLVHDPGQCPASICSTGYGYITLDTAEWLGQPRDFNQLNIVVAEQQLDTDHIKAIAGQVQNKIEKSGRLVFGTDIPEPGKHPIDSFIQPLILLLGVIGFFALLLSGFLVINTIGALLTQQTRQIGVMKSIGARSRDIVGMYLVTVLAFGILSLFVSVPLGVLGAWALIGEELRGVRIGIDGVVELGRGSANIERTVVAQAMKDLNYDANKVFPQLL
jgi:putative ABC transport system permease protein